MKYKPLLLQSNSALIIHIRHTTCALLDAAMLDQYQSLKWTAPFSCRPKPSRVLN